MVFTDRAFRPRRRAAIVDHAQPNSAHDVLMHDAHRHHGHSLIAAIWMVAW